MQVHIIKRAESTTKCGPRAAGPPPRGGRCCRAARRARAPRGRPLAASALLPPRRRPTFLSRSLRSLPPSLPPSLPRSPPAGRARAPAVRRRWRRRWAESPAAGGGAVLSACSHSFGGKSFFGVCVVGARGRGWGCPRRATRPTRRSAMAPPAARTSTPAARAAAPRVRARRGGALRARARAAGKQFRKFQQELVPDEAPAAPAAPAERPTQVLKGRRWRRWWRAAILRARRPARGPRRRAAPRRRCSVPRGRVGAALARVRVRARGRGSAGARALHPFACPRARARARARARGPPPLAAAAPPRPRGALRACRRPPKTRANRNTFPRFGCTDITPVFYGPEMKNRKPFPRRVDKEGRLQVAAPRECAAPARAPLDPPSARALAPGADPGRPCCAARARARARARCLPPPACVWSSRSSRRCRA